jgi:hypothetical protein
MRKRLPLLMCILIALAGSASAKSWRGITPLTSTKAEVLKILGKPSKSDEGSFYYDLPKEIVVIDFARGTCDEVGGKFGFGWNVTRDKVTIIGMIPKTRMTQESAGVTNSFKRDDHYADFVYFTNSDEGLQVEVHNEFVTNIQYEPTSKDESLKCPRVQDCCWDVFPRLDGYGRLPKMEVLVRYQFFIQSLEKDFGRGVVLVMGKDPAQRRNRMQVEQLNVNRYCRFLKFPIERMLVVDGGYAEQPQTELHMYPIASEINWIYIIKNPDPQPQTNRQVPVNRI